LVGFVRLIVVVVVTEFMVVFWSTFLVVFWSVVVVTASVGVVVGDVSWRRGAELDDVVNVNTKTKRRSGLDQITQCVLLREGKSRILVLAG
jgi:hypothetical protein